jgi:deoxyribonuclease-4
MVFYFGAQSKLSGKLVDAAKEIYKAGGNIMQILFISPIKKKELIELKHYLKQHNMKVVVHSDYTHNLAKNWDQYSWWIRNIEKEIKYANIIDAIGIVIHFGKQLDLTIEEAYNNMYTSLIYIHNQTIKYKNIKIFLETSTGQGSEICYKLEDLAYFYKKISKNHNKEIKNRIKICLDTCHVFAAGYNLKTKIHIKKYLETFEKLIGLRYIYLIHLNDCKFDIGSRLDRHESIGQGFIGIKGLILIFNYFRKLEVPIILETPGSSYIKEIPLLNYAQ